MTNFYATWNMESEMQKAETKFRTKMEKELMDMKTKLSGSKSGLKYLLPFRNIWILDHMLNLFYIHAFRYFVCINIVTFQILVRPSFQIKIQGRPSVLQCPSISNSNIRPEGIVSFNVLKSQSDNHLHQTVFT